MGLKISLINITANGLRITKVGKVNNNNVSHEKTIMKGIKFRLSTMLANCGNTLLAAVFHLQTKNKKKG